MDVLFDKKVDCLSIMKSIEAKEFIKQIEEVYKSRGGIEGQRDALKQKTAIVIRNRMIEDIKQGAVIPPIVLGVIVSEDDFDKLKSKTIDIEDYLQGVDNSNISIIDGMQRTTAILKAMQEGPNVSSNEIRVEYWVAKNNNSLLYRMLVLNTGQVPWNMKRQVEVIFNGIIREIEKSVDGIEVIKIDVNKIRSKSGQYQASDLVELFLAFGARSWKVDTKEKLADEFTRHDFIQGSGEDNLVNLFCDALSYLYRLDKVLEKGISSDMTEGIRFKRGYDLFTAQTARIGLITAIAEKILGRPGMDRTIHEIELENSKIKDTINNILIKIELMKSEELIEFLDFATLNQNISKKKGKVGAYEREFFYAGFKVLLEEGDRLSNLEPCWRAF